MAMWTCPGAGADVVVEVSTFPGTGNEVTVSVHPGTGTDEAGTETGFEDE